jgi:hypothetical protein
MGLVWTALWLPVTVLAMAFAGAAGLWCSAQAKTSWRSLLGTLGFVYLTAFVISCVGMPVVGIVMMLIGLVIAAVAPRGVGPGVMVGGMYQGYLVGTCVVLATGFLLATWLLLRSAEYRIGVTERTRHWEDEPRRRRRRPRGELEWPERWAPQRGKSEY